MKDGKRKPKIYPASKARFHPMWAALRAAGVNISATWPWWDRNICKSEPTNRDWREHSERCLREAAECDILILYVENGDRNFGSILEAGSALGNNKTVFLVSPEPWPFLRNHPRVHAFDTLEETISAITAGSS
jgi:hypothetical protein